MAIFWLLNSEADDIDMSLLLYSQTVQVMLLFEASHQLALCVKSVMTVIHFLSWLHV